MAMVWPPRKPVTLKVTGTSIDSLSTTRYSSRDSVGPPPAKYQVGAPKGEPVVDVIPRCGAGSAPAFTRSAVTGTPFSERTMSACPTPAGTRSSWSTSIKEYRPGATVSSNGSGVPLVAGSSRRASTSTSATSIARVEHDDLLGEAGARLARREHPRLGRRGHAEGEGDPLATIGAVEGLDAVDDQSSAPHQHLGRHLALAGDALVDERPDHAPARDHERLELRRVPHALVGGEGDVDGGVVGERVHEHQQLARAANRDAPGERPRGRHRGAARRGGATERSGHAVLHRDLAAVDLDDSARQRRLARSARRTSTRLWAGSGTSRTAGDGSGRWWWAPSVVVVAPWSWWCSTSAAASVGAGAGATDRP